MAEPGVCFAATSAATLFTSVLEICTLVILQPFDEWTRFAMKNPQTVVGSNTVASFERLSHYSRKLLLSAVSAFTLGSLMTGRPFSYRQGSLVGRGQGGALVSRRLRITDMLPLFSPCTWL